MTNSNKTTTCVCTCVCFLVRPQEGSQVIAHLVITVPDDGQIEELASMLLGQDRVNTCSMWAGQLLVYCQIIRWWDKREASGKAAWKEASKRQLFKRGTHRLNPGRAPGCELPFLQQASYKE